MVLSQRVAEFAAGLGAQLFEALLSCFLVFTYAVMRHVVLPRCVFIRAFSLHVPEVISPLHAVRAICAAGRSSRTRLHALTSARRGAGRGRTGNAQLLPCSRPRLARERCLNRHVVGPRAADLLLLLSLTARKWKSRSRKRGGHPPRDNHHVVLRRMKTLRHPPFTETSTGV